MSSSQLPFTDLVSVLLQSWPQDKQDCFLQKEGRVCVSNDFVIGESKFKLCIFVVDDEQVTAEADGLMWI